MRQIKLSLCDICVSHGIMNDNPLENEAVPSERSLSTFRRNIVRTYSGFKFTAWRHNREDDNMNFHSCENLISS
jgi:hypothetical protein